MSCFSIRALSSQLVTIREATLADVPALLHTLVTAFSQYWGKLDPPTSSKNETEAGIARTLEGATALIAEQGNEVVGCVFYADSGEYYYLFRLAVMPAFRHQSIGKKLIQQVETVAQHANLPLRLNCRLQIPENIAYYQKLGYQIIGQNAHPGYDTPTYVTMEKEIEN
jgi:ribosomal protein S18 acetylase RimI-like enzyme